MTFLYLPTSTEANHTLEDMKVAVMKAGLANRLANQEYRKKQMRLIFNMGCGPSGLLIETLVSLTLCLRAVTCGTRASMQSGT